MNLIERYVTRMGHAWNETTMDAGIDGVIELCRPDTREALNRVVMVQSKATRGRFPKESEHAFEWPCDARDLDYWLGGNAPVVLVVSRITTDGDEAYWVDIKRYFADPAARRSGRILFDKRRDRFDENCTSALLALGAPDTDGLYLPSSPGSETLYSNLLRVKSLAPAIDVAETEFRTGRELWAHFKRQGNEPGGEWVLWHRRIYSLHDLSIPPFRSICDQGTVDPIESEYFANSEDKDLTDVFVRLLRGALRQRLWNIGVRFDRDEGHYHFMAGQKLRGRAVDYRGREKQTSRAVFEAYPHRQHPDRIAYYRHSAFYGKFLRFDGEWYLEITPTYRFTSDGFCLHPFASAYLKKIKEIERNDAVLGQVIMWADLLQETLDLLRPAYPFLQFGELKTFQLPAGINDDLWRPTDQTAATGSVDDSVALDLFTGGNDEQ